MLHEQIKNGIKDAMLGKDEVRLRTLRSMVAAFTNELVAKERKPNEMLNDEEAELAILETYLPKMMNRSEVEKIARLKKEGSSINDATKKGALMSALMKELKGKADGTLVKEVVDSLF